MQGEHSVSLLKIISDRKTLIFAVNISHVESLKEDFIAEGIPALSVVGKMPKKEREDTLKDFRFLSSSSK
jgi:superfamily II DNA or RNA helicase